MGLLGACGNAGTAETAEELSFKDKLTGLYNRNYLEAESDHMVQAGEDEAKRLIDAIRGKLAEKSDEVLQLSVSFGASVIDDASITFAEAYQKADEAMYHEKQASRATRE